MNAAARPRRPTRARSRDSREAPPVSLCMIVRDEEPRLGECLESIRPHVREMVVVDTGSRDRTPHVARECGAKVYHMPWPDSFALARNESLRLATQPWGFWLDADDWCPEETGEEIRRLITETGDGLAAFHMEVRIPPGPGEYGGSVVDHVKLFSRLPGVRFEHRIHEQLLGSLRQVGIPVKPSRGWVLHKNYDRSPEGQETKRRRDMRLLALDLRDLPDHPFVLFNYGMTWLYGTDRDYPLAVHFLRRSLSFSQPESSIYRKTTAMLAEALQCCREDPAALAVVEAALGHYPDDAELLFRAAHLYNSVGRVAEARTAYERLLNQPTSSGEYRSVSSDLRTCRGPHALALLYRQLGDAPHCAEALQKLTASQPEYHPARLDLAETLLMLQRPEDARRELELVPADGSLREDVARIATRLPAPQKVAVA